LGGQLRQSKDDGVEAIMVFGRKTDVDSKRDKHGHIHVGIGELVVDMAPVQLTTVLGSCIALALYVPTKKIGGLAHILIQGDDDSGSLKYSGPATRALLAHIREKTSPADIIVAKLAGGASNTFADDNSLLRHLGKRTMLHVVGILVDEGIDIYGMHVGGSAGRNVVFDLTSGQLEVRVGGEMIVI